MKAKLFHLLTMPILLAIAFFSSTTMYAQFSVTWEDAPTECHKAKDCITITSEGQYAFVANEGDGPIKVTLRYQTGDHLL